MATEWQLATKKIEAAARRDITVLESSGPEGVRTPDLMTASHARSQLRHRPGKTRTIVTETKKSGQSRRMARCGSGLYFLRCSTSFSGSTSERCLCRSSWPDRYLV